MASTSAAEVFEKDSKVSSSEVKTDATATNTGLVGADSKKGKTRQTHSGRRCEQSSVKDKRNRSSCSPESKRKQRLHSERGRHTSPDSKSRDSRRKRSRSRHCKSEIISRESDDTQPSPTTPSKSKRKDCTENTSPNSLQRHGSLNRVNEIGESPSLMQPAKNAAGVIESTIIEEKDKVELARVRKHQKNRRAFSACSSVIFDKGVLRPVAHDVPTMILQCQGYWVECGSSADPLIEADIELESTSDQLSPGLWYRAYFSGHQHKNYIAADSSIGPTCISVLREKCKDGGYQYRTIVRRDSSTVGLCIPESSLKRNLFRGSKRKEIFAQIDSLLTTKPFLVSRESKASSLINFDGDDPPLSAPRIQRELLYFEQLELIRITSQRCFKFGVLYCIDKNVDEESMFNNNKPSKAFNEFLEVLGDKVELKGWSKYAGGLDTEKDASGKYSIYTEFEGKEIMFHVSTLLPYSKVERVQVERKRHIGNDVIVIIFKEGKKPYIPTTIDSRVNHIYIVITPEKRFGSQKGGSQSERTVYRLAVGTQEGVPPFAPPIPAGGLFEKGPAFRQFLFKKLLSGEKAAIRAPRFAERITHARERTLKHVYETLLIMKK